ncbi:anaphase-promoting complex subunit 7-like [Brachionus plicatilis]|uniref:Anaphase-promoting complex subunit 7-like n=1 Tax=Brachionus plicatilis TaxID=10195 RepID=A0A3M7RCW8_BRAPC|nr:anaphase-promoting complex subunit 7-like [Brachionus plicatilis]
MKEFFALLDHLKSLYENGLYEDVKLLADLLIATTESSPVTSQPFFSSANTSTAFSSSSSQSSAFSGIPFQCDPKDKYTILFLYANAVFNLREYKTAEALFNKALQINRSNLKSKPKTLTSLDSETDIQIKFNLHLCLFYDKKYQDAYLILDSIPSKQRTVKILMAMGKLCQILMNNKEAITIYKEVLKISKFSIVAIEALLNLGLKMDDLPKMPSNISTDWLNIYLKGKSNLISRDYKEAIKSFKTLDSNLTHRSAEVLCSLANSQYLNGEYSNAISSFEKLHKLEPTWISKMDIYAFLLFSDKSEFDKLSTLERLANDMHQVSVNIPETWTIIGYYSLKKKSQKAKCFAENALLIDHENCQALLLRAIALGKLKAISESAVTYREATRINIYFYEAYKGLVETLLNLNHTKDAIQIAANAVKLLGSNHRTLALYGEALSRDSLTQEKSKTYLYKAIKGDPENQEAVICLVRVCMTLQQFTEALEVLGKYIRHNPSNPRLMHIYSELMKKCGKSDEAIIYMNKASGMDTANLQMKSMIERAEQNIETSLDESIQNFHAS